ncbi:protein kinase [Sorangium sp. So ce448]|uniref:serine/threonine protein kinase n=1 Tax=Sorangium sp. So ce448 TaxID=3133314 RepID=UPI003F60B89D
MTPAARYTILETLSGEGRAVVHRARRDADGHPVILKVLDPRRSGPKELEQLRREYELGTLFDTPAVVRPLALATYQGMHALVLVDEGADSLDGLLGEPMPMDRFLPVAIRIAGAVAEIHGKDVIHKDLKPQNILVSPASGEVKITDFGLASRLPREHRPTQPARLIEGSLPYLAPEQTGRRIAIRALAASGAIWRDASPSGPGTARSSRSHRGSTTRPISSRSPRSCTGGTRRWPS